jgi:epoxyqueuosine reductase
MPARPGPQSRGNAAGLVAALRGRSQALGFDVCRITDAALPAETGERLAQFVAQGRHGNMAWMADTLDRRRDPRSMWEGARSAIVLGMNYGPQSDPLAILGKPGHGAISVYARNRDYHDVIKGRLKTLAQFLTRETQAEVKVFVDTAPLMEKPLAGQAGLGWQGKHTNLVSREFGSWLFLGVILTSAQLPADEPESDHCGNCRACLDICPTSAFPAPYQLDARRCISYLTIEHAGPIPNELRGAMGNRIYGCDDCLAVCPWTKFAGVAREMKLQARQDLEEPDLAFLASLDDPAFRAFFAGSPVKRIGRNRFIRNVLIAIGNSGDGTFADAARAHLVDPSPLVRGTAVWALAKLLGKGAIGHLFALAAAEPDPQVRSEYELALAGK